MMKLTDWSLAGWITSSTRSVLPWKTMVKLSAVARWKRTAASRFFRYSRVWGWSGPYIRNDLTAWKIFRISAGTDLIWVMGSRRSMLAMEHLRHRQGLEAA